MIAREISNLILVKLNLIDKKVNLIKNTLFISLNRAGIYCNFNLKNETYLIEHEIVFATCLQALIITSSFTVIYKALSHFILNNIHVCVNYLGDSNQYRLTYMLLDI